MIEFENFLDLILYLLFWALILIGTLCIILTTSLIIIKIIRFFIGVM